MATTDSTGSFRHGNFSYSARSTESEIQRWDEESLDNEYLTREDVMKEHFFWNLIQTQKDQLYNLYVEEESRLSEEADALSASTKSSIKEKNVSTFNSPPYSLLCTTSLLLVKLLDQVKLFQDFIRAREDDFVEIMLAYDRVHGTSVRIFELHDLRNTHAFLNGERLLELEDQIKQTIKTAEDVLVKGSEVSNKGGSNFGNLRRRSTLFGKNIPASEQFRTSTKSIGTNRTNNTMRNSMFSEVGEPGHIPVIPEQIHQGEVKRRPFSSFKLFRRKLFNRRKTM